MDKLAAMQTFVAVAEAGSFVAVANRMRVARSVVTRQIASLEHHLGSKLLTRSTRRLALTTLGSSYLEKCRVILNMVDSAEATVAEEKAQARGRIRVGLPLIYGLQTLLPALLDFAQEQPLIELVMDFSDQRSNLIEEGLDLSLRITADLQPGDIARTLGAVRLRTVASTAYLKRHGTPRTPDDLRHHECLIYSRQAGAAHWTYFADKKPMPVAVRGRLTANNGAALLEAAARNMGIARQPDFISVPYIQRGLVRPILADYEPPLLGIYALLPSNRYVPHRVRVLLDYLSGRIKREASTTAP